MLQNFLNLQVIILEMSTYICMEDFIDLSGVNQVLLPAPRHNDHTFLL